MKDNVKVFISQRMNGLPNDIIHENRKILLYDFIQFLKSLGIEPQTCDVVNEIELEEGHERVWYLGQSISTMESADFVIFALDYSKALGCQVEHAVAERYFKNSIAGGAFGHGHIAEIWWNPI